MKTLTHTPVLALVMALGLGLPAAAQTNPCADGQTPLFDPTGNLAFCSGLMTHEAHVAQIVAAAPAVNTASPVVWQGDAVIEATEETLVMVVLDDGGFSPQFQLPDGWGRGTIRKVGLDPTDDTSFVINLDLIDNVGNIHPVLITLVVPANPLAGQSLVYKIRWR